MSKSLMIIGVGPGIGQAVARRFGREGWQIVLTGRSAQRLDSLVAELKADGITAHAAPADATDAEALRAALAKAEALTGGLSAVHFNAGVVRNQDLFSMSDAEIVSDLAIDVAAGFNTIRDAEMLAERLDDLRRHMRHLPPGALVKVLHGALAIDQSHNDATVLGPHGAVHGNDAAVIDARFFHGVTTDAP